jgi:conjugal transfer pilus assembly protein TraE
MKLSIFTSRLDNAIGEKKFYKIVMLLMMGITLILVFAVFKLSSTQRTIFLPPTVNKSFWVDENHVSKEYLEQMGMFLAQLELTVSPASYQYQTNALLKYVHPSAYGDLQRTLAAQGDKLARDNSSTVFTPVSVTADSEHNRLAIAGQLATYISDKLVTKEQKTYYIDFIYTDAKLYLKTFTEATDNDPLHLNTPAPKTASADSPAT